MDENELEIYYPESYVKHTAYAELIHSIEGSS